MIDVRASALVARREIRQQVRGKALWISTLLTVIAIALLVVLPKLLSGGTTVYRVAVTGAPSPAVTAAIDASAASVGAHVRIRPVAGRAAADAALKASGDQHADIAVDTSGAGSVVVDRAVKSDATDRKTQVVRAIARSLAAVRAVEHSGLPASQAQALVDPKPLAVEHLRSGPGSSTSRVVAIAGSILFFIMVIRYGIGLLVGVAQEKATRVVEVILSAARPVDLLTGKVVGSTVIVLAQAALLVSTALISAAAVGSTILHGSGIAQIVVEGVWIVLGFLLYAALFAAAGALAAKSEDAQSLALPLQIPLFIGYFASLSTSGSDTVNGFVKVLAYIPFTAPMNLPLLSASGAAGPLQVAISMLITAVSIVVVTRLAAALFRSAILRTGQRVRVRQLLRDRRITQPVHP